MRGARNMYVPVSTAINFVYDDALPEHRHLSELLSSNASAPLTVDGAQRKYAKASKLSDVALQYYGKLHDTLVTNALYAKFYGFSSELITKFVTGTASCMSQLYCGWCSTGLSM
jgi:hypothetical protein